MTLGEWLNRMILEDDLPEDITAESQFADRFARTDGPPRLMALSASPDLTRVAHALDRLTDRIEASETRTGLAISGVEHSIRHALARIETAEREQLAVTSRLEGAIADAAVEQVAFSDRLRRLEDSAGPRSLEAIRVLEARVARVQPEAMVETVLARLGDRIAQAEARTADALEDLKVSLSALDQRVWSVERAGPEQADVKFEALAQVLTHRVEALRAETAERLAQASSSPQVEARLAEMAEHIRRSEKRASQAVEEIGRQVLAMADAVGRKLQDVDDRGAAAIDQVGTEIARIAGAVELRLARAEHTQAEAFQKLSDDLARATEDLTRRVEAAGTAQTEAAARVAPPPPAEPSPPGSDSGDSEADHGWSLLGPPPEPEPEAAPEPVPAEQAAPDPSLSRQLDAQDTAPPVSSAPFGPELFSRAEEEPAASETVTATWRRLEVEPPELKPRETFAPIPEAEDDDIFAADAPDPPPVRGPQLSTREVIDQARAAARAARDGEEPVGEIRATVSGKGAAGRLFQGFGDALAGRPRRVQNTALQTALMVAGGAAFLSVGAAGITLMQSPSVARQEAPAPFGGATAPRAAVALAPGLTPRVATAAGPSSFERVKADVEAGITSALPQLRALAEAGDPEAQLYLGQLYDVGEAGLVRDPVEARRLTALAAQSGTPAAMHNLGVYYFRGEGGPADFAQAARWFQKAAEAGVVESQYNLGLLYQSGSGTEKNLSEARRWFQKAAEQGDEQARRALADLGSEPSAKAVRPAAPRRAEAPHAAPAHATPARAPRAAHAEPAASPNVRQAQQILSRLGYYDGPADGHPTEAYKVALFRYQQDQRDLASGPKPYATER